MTTLNYSDNRQKTAGQKLLYYMTGALLCASAGMMNGVSTSAVVFERTSHMSGRINNLLWTLFISLPSGLLIAAIIAGFLLGAFCAAILFPRLGIKILLGVIALQLTAATIIHLSVDNLDRTIYSLPLYIIAFLLAASGGLQNGTTSLLPLGRTTHVTGDMTDMAINISVANWWQAGFLFMKITAFAIGGAAGFFSLDIFSISIVLILCATMVAVGFASLYTLSLPNNDASPERTRQPLLW